MSTYTEEQIQSVCDAGYEIMGKFTDVQNCQFPSTAIIEGMKAGLSAEEIADNAYNAVAKLPTKPQLIGMFAGAIMSPISKFAYACDQIAKAKENA